MIQNFFDFRNANTCNYQVNTILAKEDLTDEDKLKQILALDFLRTQVGASGNFRLIEFLSQKQNLEKLIKFSVAVPNDPENKDESYR